ncbi:MAG: hypothetical protein HYT96_05095 [Armatimonadetes bacterium]|nr:hypothetical protein [Armatimonadota bacterium]
MAPALIASKRNSSSLCTVSMIKPVRGLVALMIRAASIPERFGIAMSRRTTSGASSSTMRTVCSPLFASPTTSISRAASSNLRTP